MIKRTAAIILALTIVLFSAGTAIASSGSERAALRASDYLKLQQHDDGGFGAKDSTVSETSVAVIALRTAGRKLPKSKSGKSSIDYLKANAPALATSDKKAAVQNTAKISQMIIALKLAGENPKKFAGIDWVKFLLDNQEKATGWFGAYDIDHMWALLALESAGETPNSTAVKWLQSKQSSNGGYQPDTNGGMAPDTNSTALAIQALVGAGVDQSDSSVRKAVAYLETQQNTDGGFPYVTPSTYGTDSDTSSTAWVIQGLIAAGEDIEGKHWVKAAITPMGFLMSMQNADGAFAYQKVAPDDSELSTAQAIPALMTKSFPVKPTSPVSTAEKLPADNANFSTGSMAWIIAGAVAVIVVILGIGYALTRRKGN
jgi:prenyltransferase beta subunit